MGDKFTIQISPNLVNQLAGDGRTLKKKTKKPKSRVPLEREPSTPKVTQKQASDDSEIFKVPAAAAGWPILPPLYLPVTPPPQFGNEELDAIRSVIQDSEKTLERLQKQEETMLQEVTQRAKDLHDKEFKLSEQKAIFCVEERDVCLKCYKENLEDPLKCSSLVNDFANCVRRVRQQVGKADK